MWCSSTAPSPNTQHAFPYHIYGANRYAAGSRALDSAYLPDDPFVKSEAPQPWSTLLEGSVWTGNLLVGNRQLGKMLNICVRCGSVGDCYARIRAEEHSLDAQVDCMQLLYSHASLAALHFLAADGRCFCLSALRAVYNA